MSVALNATGRPILYSMCNWGEDGPWNFASVGGSAHGGARRADVLSMWPRLSRTAGASQGTYTTCGLLRQESSLPNVMWFQDFGRFDDRCPCTSVLDCKLPGFRASPCVATFRMPCLTVNPACASHPCAGLCRLRDVAHHRFCSARRAEGRSRQVERPRHARGWQRWHGL